MKREKEKTKYKYQYKWILVQHQSEIRSRFLLQIISMRGKCWNEHHKLHHKVYYTSFVIDFQGTAARAFHNHKNDARGGKRNIGYTVDNASLTVFYDVALEVARVRKQISRLTEGDRHWSRHQGPGGRLMGVRNDSEHHPFPANEGEEGKEDGRRVARWWPSCGWLDARRVNECARGVN